jgi:hypothetical protein
MFAKSTVSKPNSAHGNLPDSSGCSVMRDPIASVSAARARWAAENRQVIGVGIFRMTQLILIVDLELLGRFGALVDRAHRRLILTRVFIVSVIVVIVSTTRRVRGENQSLKLAQGVEFWVYGGHARILINIKGS